MEVATVSRAVDLSDINSAHGFEVMAFGRKHIGTVGKAELALLCKGSLL